MRPLRELEIERHLVVSKAAEITRAYETSFGATDIRALADFVYSPNDIGVPIASGSFKTIGNDCGALLNSDPERYCAWYDSLHYEFLDNDVPRGETPLTAAFGWSGEMNILDIKCMLDICRYQKINVNAKSRAEVYPDETAMRAERNAEFLASCVRKFPQVNFADRETGRIYARFAAGRLEWADSDALERAVADADAQAALRVVAPDLFSASRACPRREPAFLPKNHFPTLGRWERA